MEITTKDGSKEIYNERGYNHDYMSDHEYASKGVANTALGLGIAGTALGLGALMKNGGFNLFGKSSNVPENVNINTYDNGVASRGYGYFNNGWNYFGGCPTIFQTWEKECEDNIALTRALYQMRINDIQDDQAARQIDVDEKFQLWKSQVDADFGLYKSTRDNFDAVTAKQNADAFALYKNQRDNFDALSARIGNLETKQAIADAVEPWRAKVLDMRINGVAAGAQSAVELEAERRCCADGKIVNYVNSTFVPQTIAEPTIGSATHSESTYNPLCSCCSIYQ